MTVTSEEQGTTGLPAWTIAGLVGILVILALVALALGVARQGFDQDEIEHAHATWQIAVGNRPFHDFFECHPPFGWYLFAPLYRLWPHSTNILFLFRSLSALGNVLFMAVLMYWGSRALNRIGAALCLGLASALAASEGVRHFLVEFRPDCWSYLLFAGGVGLMLGQTPRRRLVRYVLFAAAMAVAVLTCPKLAVLVVAISLADLVILGCRAPRALADALLGHLVGIVGALGLAVGFLVLVGVNPITAFDLTVVYHWRFLQHASFPDRLFFQIAGRPFPLLIAALGIGAWIWRLVTRSIKVQPLEIGTAAFLVFEIITLSMPHKQYFAPWFLLTLVFLPHFAAVLQTRPRRLALPVCALVLAIASTRSAIVVRARLRTDSALWSQEFFGILNAAIHDDGRVIAAMPFHPVVHRNVFYGWVNSYDPGGYRTEELMADWPANPYAKQFTEGTYRAELEANPPALIVSFRGNLDLTPIQTKVVTEYIQANRGKYVAVTNPQWVVLVRLESAKPEFLRQFQEQQQQGR